MKIIRSFLLLSVGLAVILILNVHVIRMDDGVDIITKDTMCLRDSYVDVRDWQFRDYMRHSPRIRNYLLHDVYYASAVRSFQGRFDDAADTAIGILRRAENFLQGLKHEPEKE